MTEVIVKFGGTSGLVLMTGLSLIAHGCEERLEPQSGRRSGNAPEDASPQPAAEDRGFAQPQRRFEQSEQLNRQQPSPSQEPDE